MSSESSESSESDVKFLDFNLAQTVHEDIRKAGFERPTPIQAACIPPALEGKDIIGLAQTGTGKTAAFALPIINRMTNRPEMGALVLAPTRELAAQIAAAFEQLGASSGIRVACVVGGIKIENDYNALRGWPNVLVATPGRLIDHIESKTIVLDEIEVLTVDEADRMHDMGFMPQIRRIIAELPHDRQTMMFTATMPRDVEQIARRSMNNPIRLQIGICAPAHRAKQELFAIAEDDKGPFLLKLLRKSEGRVLVFLRTKRGVDRLARRITNRGIKAMRIHGDLEQDSREKSLSAFRDGQCRILIATDIAARGLDVSNIEQVINYDFPHHAEDYVHRIGRTARVEASGLATSFVTRDDQRFVGFVRKLIGDKLPQLMHLDGTPAAPAPVEKKSKPRGNGKYNSNRRSRSRSPSR